MTNQNYDAIVVGARCAGAPTAMLLARRGYRVLVVDRAAFPSDTVSTHLIHPPGVAALDRRGLLSQVVGSGCPPIDTYRFDFGPLTIEGSPAGAGFQAAYAPRRTVLDKILADAARESGAEVREGFTVEDLVIEGDTVTGIRGHGAGGRSVTEYARVVVGADGIRSLVAKAVGAVAYAEKPKLQCSYYSYWTGLPMNGRFETYVRPDRAFATWPTKDGRTVVICGLPMRDFEANRPDVEADYLATMALVPSFAERAASATRVERIVGMGVPNFFRRPYGPGWALVGDAGYLKDFITAQGIQDAFRDAELCARALDQTFTGRRSFDTAMKEYQESRDGQVMPMYEFTAQLASMDPPPAELQQLLGAVSHSRPAMDAFARMAAGVTSPAEFFSDGNLERLLR
ncbi:NAD(P)/FAD-dependent oxidoreductase [Streptomyces sp. ISL-43]|uniref:NAD(P)/FAD-dependent oxidoreductase n=1 Tax=Streptomyces sp. ISL-43 TaxID=2819183 RepID=UPI001BEB144A|nr:NAD(P)/FAD-dependent oxidoreductase [Streptomyces sp. ISL-43]MBT2448668.1 NAD(P)/FAD-dependent oxidoreductase [Streptomyces sp. ISL-43]